MGIRDKNYKDYGLSDREVKILFQMCRDIKWRPLLQKAANKSNSGIAKQIADSLHFGWSYRTIDCKNYIPVSVVDFYAYRRKALWLFSKEIKEVHNGVIPEFLI